MDKTAEVIYGLINQTVSVYPPEAILGVPSSATAAVYAGTTSNDDATEFAPTVTVDAVATTVDAASGYSQSDRRKLYLTSTTGVTVGVLYRLENTTGQVELVKPVFVAANDYVLLDSDLAYDYASSSTFKGIRLVFTVNATWVATESKISAPMTGTDRPAPSYRVIWAYSVASVVRRHYTYLRLVRQAFKHGVTVDDLTRYAPDIVLDEPGSVRGQAYSWAIDAAADRLRVDLITSGWKPEQPRDSEILNQLVIRGALYIVARHRLMAGEDVMALVESLKKDYDDLLNASIRAVLRIDVDQGTEGASMSEPVPQLWFVR